MKSSCFKTVLVGMGQMGRHHFRILSEDPRFDLLGVVDPVLSQLPSEGPQLWRHVDEARDLAIDLAVIAAPTELHFGLVKTLLERNCHVLVEKPAAGTAAEAEELVALAQRRDLCLAVGNIERCNPVVAALQAVLDQKLLGPLVHLSGLRAGAYPPHVKAGNDVILDLGVHELDVFRMLLGPLHIVQSKGHTRRKAGVIDVAEILVENQHGVSGQIHVSWFSPERQRKIRVTGERGIAQLDYIAQRLDLICFQKPEEDGGFAWSIDAQGIARTSVPVAGGETLKLQLGQLYRLLTGEPHHLATGEQLIESVQLIEAARLRAEAAGQHRSSKALSL